MKSYLDATPINYLPKRGNESDDDSDNSDSRHVPKRQANDGVPVSSAIPSMRGES